MLSALLKANAGNETDLLRQLQALQALQAGGAPAPQVPFIPSARHPAACRCIACGWHRRLMQAWQ